MDNWKVSVIDVEKFGEKVKNMLLVATMVTKFPAVACFSALRMEPKVLRWKVGR